MNYEKKYKEALEKASKLKVQNPFDTVGQMVEHIFPELQESEDERIRKGIIRNLQYLMDRSEGFVKEDLQERIAWLEKQGKSNTFKVPETSIKVAEEVTPRMQYIEDDMKPIAEFIINYANWDLHKDEWNQPTLTVPLFRVLDALIQRGKPYGECVQNIEKQGENEPTDKVKPKFKVGDWILNNVCFPMQIASIKDGMYVFTEGDAISVSFIDENYHLWTIHDAMDGDVLASKGKGGQEVGIVKRFIGKYGGYNNCFETYCYSDLDGTFRTGEYMGGNTIHPATKEQCDLLFQKMKEAGYVWDANKKELKKMEAVSKESEDERIRKGLINGFKECLEDCQYPKNAVKYWHDLEVDSIIAWLEKQTNKD